MQFKRIFFSFKYLYTLSALLNLFFTLTFHKLITPNRFGYFFESYIEKKKKSFWVALSLPRARTSHSILYTYTNDDDVFHELALMPDKARTLYLRQTHTQRARVRSYRNHTHSAAPPHKYTARSEKFKETLNYISFLIWYAAHLIFIVISGVESNMDRSVAWFSFLTLAHGPPTGTGIFMVHG